MNEAIAKLPAWCVLGVCWRCCSRHRGRC